jgi:DNA-binding PadR family transcriptional regulator
VLRESGVVSDEVSGRRRIYRLTVDGLEPLLAWLAELTSPPSTGAAWSARLDALDTEVRRTRRDRARRAENPGSAESMTATETTRETA